MTGYRPGLYWQYTWRYIGPVIMSLILLASVINMIIYTPKYSGWDAENVQHIVIQNHLSSRIKSICNFQAITTPVPYPNWVLAIALAMITAGVLPMPIVFLLRRFQILGVDLDIHQGSIRRNETTASTKVMMDDDDVSREFNCLYKCFGFHWFDGVGVKNQITF